MTDAVRTSEASDEGRERLVAPSSASEDGAEASLRPQTLSEFIGQASVRENLAVFISAARGRGEALDHLLFSGPPGLGKTTLAQIVARELGVGFRTTSGPILAKQGDLAAVLTNLQPRDVLFIDEIHRLNPSVEEILYPAMEDFQLDLIIGEGPAARSIRIDLPPFTLIGATTRSGLIATPLRDRFGIPLRLEFYSEEELQLVVERAARVFDIELTSGGANEIAKRSRGTPRISGRLLKRVRDFAAVDGLSTIDVDVADSALGRLDVDRRGLDTMDRRYLTCLAENYEGGPVGVETLGAALAEQRDVLEEVLEPFLIQQGFVQRTARGRMLTARGWSYLGISPPKTIVAQMELIEDIEDGND
jgi:Holliday junction DNA helicase RuvB